MDAETIYSGLKNAFEELSGLRLNSGGDMALRFRALSEQLLSLWAQSDFVLMQSFPQTAAGAYLDYHAELKNLARAPAAKSRGTLRFIVLAAAPSDITVPAGTLCMTDDEREYVTTEAGTITAGSLSCTVAAEAVSTGSAGNTPAFTAMRMELPPVGVYGCSCPFAFTGGSDEEDDESLRARLLQSYRSASFCANSAFYKQLALSVDGVCAASVVPKNRGTGTVDVFISSAEGAPSAALISAVNTKLQAEREICTSLMVKAPTQVTVNISAAVRAVGGVSFAAVKTRVENTVRAYFSGELLGQDLVFSSLGSAINQTDGVYYYQFTPGCSDVSIDSDELPVLGTLSVTEM